MARGTPVNNFINRIEGQVASGAITPEQGQRLIADAKETAGPDGMLSYNEREGLSADLRVDKAYTAQFTSTPTPTPPPTPNPTPTPTPSPGFQGPISPVIRIKTPIPPPVPPTPPPPPPPAFVSVKQATPDIIIFDEEIDPEYLTQTFFQEFGGTELINISRSDLINGEDVSYSPIINLSSLRQSFNPNNIIAIGAFQETPTRYSIDLFLRGVVDPYFDESGNLIIEIDEVRPDESIEIEIATDGTINRIEL